MKRKIKGLKFKVVCATKGSQEDFFSKTMTGQSLSSWAKISESELMLFSHNKESLGSVYNKAIESCKDDPAVLVFVHDDVYISDFHWKTRVLEGLEHFDIVGIAGNTRRQPNQAGWIMLNTNGELDLPQYLSGAIGQGTEFPPKRIDVFGTPGLQCKLLDGVFLAVASETCISSGLRFDPKFPFHFYDLDFCRTAETLQLTMGTIALSMVHGSLGNLNDAWYQAYQNYLHKWGH